MPHPQTEVSVFLASEQIYHRLLPTGEYIIGSADDADIRFSSDQLAPHHARLVIGPCGDTIEDPPEFPGLLLEWRAPENRLRSARFAADRNWRRFHLAPSPFQRASRARRFRNLAAQPFPSSKFSAETAQPLRGSRAEPLAFPPQKYNIGGLVAVPAAWARFSTVYVNGHPIATSPRKSWPKRTRPDPRQASSSRPASTAQLESIPTSSPSTSSRSIKKAGLSIR